LLIRFGKTRYSLLFARRGANVVVNDFNGAAAQKVVDEIIKGVRSLHTCLSCGLIEVLMRFMQTDGGKAVANTSSVTDGAAVIKSALDAFGGVTILINNAGILRDKGYVLIRLMTFFCLHGHENRFKNMTDADFDSLIAVHLKGSFACTKAAWPIFRKQKFGRIINTSSAAGLYGT
jgi:multifunctional beta-oxidation protein